MRNPFVSLERLEIYGMMPERALLRLKRAGIALYEIKKIDKHTLRLAVRVKDAERVFAIYPKAGGAESVYTAYSIRSLGRTGVGRCLDFCKNRVGILLGALLFCGTLAYADGLVLGVEFSESAVYQREAYALLEEYGITPFSRYQVGNEDLICSKLLSLDGVEFCSVKKSGLRVVVEIRLGDAPRAPYQTGDMQATRTGVVLSITALKGTPQKKAGDSVQAGETLVGGWMENGEGERTETAVIARASIACTYERVVEANSEKEAFAVAYLDGRLEDGAEITDVFVEKRENGYAVRIAYTAIESMNL